MRIPFQRRMGNLLSELAERFDAIAKLTVYRQMDELCNEALKEMIRTKKIGMFPPTTQQGNDWFTTRKIASKMAISSYQSVAHRSDSVPTRRVSRRLG